FKISVCADQKRFGRKCIGPIDLKDLGDRAAVVQFDPVGMRGRVEGHTGEGTVTIVGAAGLVSEEAQLHEDGSFLFHAQHVSPEYLIYVRRTSTMTVLPLPIDQTADLVIVVPSVTAS